MCALSTAISLEHSQISGAGTKACGRTRGHVAERAYGFAGPQIVAAM